MISKNDEILIVSNTCPLRFWRPAFALLPVLVPVCDAEVPTLSAIPPLGVVGLNVQSTFPILLG